MLKTKRVVELRDIKTEKAYLDRDPALVALVELAKVRTLLAVPMLKDNELIGAIGIYRQEMRPFTDRQIELVTSFAAQAVIAIENSRLLSELRQRTGDLSKSLERQTATSEVLNVISNSVSDAQPVFNAIVQSALKLFPDAAILIALRDGETLRAAPLLKRMLSAPRRCSAAGLFLSHANTIMRSQFLIAGSSIFPTREKRRPNFRLDHSTF